MTHVLDDDRFVDQTIALGAANCRTFSLIPFADIHFSDRQRWLVKGLIASSGLAIIFGAKKEYKSFIALDLALHVVTGRPWAGRKVRPGAVIYVVGEGASGFSDRVAANRERDNLPADAPFYLIKAKPNLGAGPGDTAALIAAIQPVVDALATPLSAIFIDTVVRTLAGSNENDEGLRNFADNSEAIAEHFDCVTIGVHHVGKDAGRGMRGSSTLGGAVVTSWRVEKVRKFRAKVTIEDAKDGESDLTWHVDLDRYVYGHDEDGEEKAVLVVTEVGEPTTVEPEKSRDAGFGSRLRPVPPQLCLLVSCLDTCMSASRVARPYSDGPEIRVVTVAALRAEYFARRGDAKSNDARRKSFENSLRTGVERKLLIVETVGNDQVIWKP